jgi:hypothetical protein
MTKLHIEYLGRDVEQTFNVLTKQLWDNALVSLPTDKSIGEAKERRHKELKKFEPYVIDDSAMYKSIVTGEVELPFVAVLTSPDKILVKTSLK